jgi:hypothetical protein
MSFIRKTVAIADLKTNSNNPRDLSNEALQDLQDSLKDYPELLAAQSIFCDQNLVVYGGNQRLQALKNLGITEIEVVIYDLPKEQIETMAIRSNVHSGTWNLKKLKTMPLPILKSGGLNLQFADLPTINSNLPNNERTNNSNEYATDESDDHFATTQKQATKQDAEALTLESNTNYANSINEFKNESTDTLFPLSIVLTKQEKQAWDKFKSDLKEKGYKGAFKDTTALQVIIDNLPILLSNVPTFQEKEA